MITITIGYGFWRFFVLLINHVKEGSFFNVEINDMHILPPLRVVWQSSEKLTFGKKLFTTCFSIYLSCVIYLKRVDPQSCAVVVVVAVVVVAVVVESHDRDQSCCLNDMWHLKQRVTEIFFPIYFLPNDKFKHFRLIRS